MRRDSIFYKLFQQTPPLLFELLPKPPANAAQYRFDSVAVKEPKFEIDGVFLPPDTAPGIVYFCEVQFQRDELLYERLFGESLLYFYRNRSRFTDWCVVVIYPTRSTEQLNTLPYRSQLNSDQVHRVYLDELGAIEQLPLGLALMALTTVPEAQTPAVARALLARSQSFSASDSSQEASPAAHRAIIEMLTTILVYKFTDLSRREAEAMLGISLQETRFYREAKAEGREEGREEGEQSGKCSLVLRLLGRRVGEVPQPLQMRIQALTAAQLETLGEALLDFTQLADLHQWLDELPR